VRVFVAGATGAIGRPLVRLLRVAGHEVTGITRKPERAEALRAEGADAVVADVLDAEEVRRAVEAAHPEVIVNQVTDIPPKIDPRGRIGETSRLRVEGTRNLIEAAVPGGARRIVVQSVAFLYAPEGDGVKDEEARTWTDAPGEFGNSVAAALEMEDMVVRAPDVEGVVLRYGYFYGPGTHFAADGGAAEEVRRRRFPVVGRGTGLFSMIHIEDAATATALAVEHGRPGVYNVVDDEPAEMRELVPAYAEAIGAKPPRRVPKLLARMVAGKLAAQTGTEGRGASNVKAKRELGWVPRYASWRDGFREGLG
jgi:2-alkyl-3-oxoalkanoate reductase